MRFWIFGGCFLFLVLQLTACGSVISTSKIQQAQTRVDSDEFTMASEYSVYESVLATTYLERARTEWAHSDWQHAQKYAENASLWADRAIERAEKKTKATGVNE